MTWALVVYLMAGWSHAVRTEDRNWVRGKPRETWESVLVEIVLWFPIAIGVCWILTRKKET